MAASIANVYSVHELSTHHAQGFRFWEGSPRHE